MQRHAGGHGSGARKDLERLAVAWHRLAGGDTLARALHEARGSIDTEDPGSFVNWCTFSAHGGA